MLRITGKQLLVLQILLVDHQMGKMPFIADTVLFAHFECIENMDFSARHIDFVRQRRDKVGVKLILQLRFVT